jgi:mannose-6-phosphate isomerase
MNGELPGKFVDKPWGRDRLPAYYGAPPARRIGEIWFQPPSEMCRLLAKYLFTTQRVSVQAHPNDAQTEARGLGRRGKDECWLIVEAEPEASLGIGFDRHLEADALRAASLDGTIEQMLVWYPVRAGDFFYIPANTVHAIGAGITLLEVEQNSDVTYRLYDYGRDRELHLDEGLPIAKAEPYPEHLHRHVEGEGAVCLVEGPYFRVDRVVGSVPAETRRKYGEMPLLVLPLAGEIRVGDSKIGQGHCGIASEIAQIAFSTDANCVLAQPT